MVWEQHRKGGPDIRAEKLAGEARSQGDSGGGQDPKHRLMGGAPKRSSASAFPPAARRAGDPAPDGEMCHEGPTAAAAGGERRVPEGRAVRLPVLATPRPRARQFYSSQETEADMHTKLRNVNADNTFIPHGPNGVQQTMNTLQCMNPMKYYRVAQE